jgi:hypothetical protein
MCRWKVEYMICGHESSWYNNWVKKTGYAGHGVPCRAALDAFQDALKRDANAPMKNYTCRPMEYETPKLTSTYALCGKHDDAFKTKYGKSFDAASSESMKLLEEMCDEHKSDEEWHPNDINYYFDR